MKVVSIASVFMMSLLSFVANCQTSNEIDTNIVLNKVSRNFLLFRVVRAEKHIKSLFSKDGYLSSTVDIEILKYLPGDGCRLEILLKEQQYKFPDNNFKVFEVVKRRGLYLCKDVRRDFNLYPYDEERRMLIAVHKRTNQVIFISGNFFLQDIRHYFDFTKSVKTFEEYLSLRYFMYGIDEVKFKSKSGRNYYFEGKNIEGKLIADIKVRVKNNAIQHVYITFW